MNRGLLRYYLMGLIMVIMAANIPEVSTFLNEKAIIASPVIKRAITMTVDRLSDAIAPLTGKIIGSPKLLINGVIQNVDTTNNFALTHGQSLTADQIDQILKSVNSPAIGTGGKWIKSGIDHNIDAAYMVYIFMQESGAATNKGWAGWKPNGSHTYNIGNMICSGYDGNKDNQLDCYNGFRDYSWSSDPWYEGIDDNTANLAFYRDQNNIKDFDKAITQWAPPTENNTAAYIEQGHITISGWRNINKVSLTDAQAVSAPITVDENDPFGYNVNVALDSNNGALRHITIKDGDQWSFNGALKKPDKELKIVSGVYGGGWCDLACRYVQVFKGLGLSIQHVPLGYSENMPKDGQIIFIQHGGIALNQCSYDESPYIWSDWTGGFHDGLQDLIVNNTTGKTIQIDVIENDNKTVIIVGKVS